MDKGDDVGRGTTKVGTLLAALVGLGGSALLGAGPAQAADLAPGFYKPAFTNTITRVEVINGVSTHHAVSYQEWQQAGFPAPQPSPTEYVKYTWAPYIAAVTYWPDGLQWDGLDGPMWQRAGSPQPRIAGYIAGTQIMKYASSPELIARIKTPGDETSHKLTPTEWRAMGSPAPSDHPDTWFYVRTWNSMVLACLGRAENAQNCNPEPYDSWTTLGQPTPLRVQLYYQDIVQTKKGTHDIYVYGPGLEPEGHLLTPAEWRAAGSPADRN